MVSDEDARVAARRIVREVLASREQTAAEERAGADGLTGPDGASAPSEGGSRVGELVDTAVVDLAADGHVEVEEPEVSETRARARALVAEVLAEHAARAAEAQAAADAAEAAREAETLREAEAAPVASGTGPDTQDEVPLLFGGSTTSPDEDVPSDAVPETTARWQARELVAAVLAEAEAREAAEAADEEARAAAEAEAQAAREREEEAARELAAAREREEEAARELAAALAEEAERAAWAEADRDVAGETVRMDRRDPADTALEQTAPLSVAELAAAERSTRPDLDQGPDGPDGPEDGDAERTLALPIAGETTTAEDPGRTQLVEAPDDPRTLDRSAPRVLTALDGDQGRARLGGATAAPSRQGATVTEADPAVLEATVGVDDVVERPRTGRWLLASVLGAVTLAIVFPLAIRALLDLVALS